MNDIQLSKHLTSLSALTLSYSNKLDDLRLTEHFKLSELTKSATASKYGIKNEPNEEQIANLRALCEEVLEPLRQWYGKPIVIGSGFRCPQLNSRPSVRGATNSQHIKGEAADLHIPTIKAPNGSTIQDMATARSWIEWLLDNHFDQLILEHDKSGHYWIHVNFKRNGKNRQTYLPNLLKK